MNFARPLKVLLLCSLVIAAACGLHDLHSPKNTNSSPAGSASPAADANPLDTMTASISAQLAAKSYRARIESSFDGKNITQTVEYVAPDRFRLANPMSETIIVGPNTYTKLPTGKWQKFPIDVNQAISQFRDPKMIDELRKTADVKFLGTDTIDGMPMKVYQYTIKKIGRAHV